MTHPSHAKPVSSTRIPTRPAEAGNHCAAVAAARDLLARTAELPGSKRDLLAVLGEYRRAVFVLTSFEGAPITASE